MKTAQPHFHLETQLGNITHAQSLPLRQESGLGSPLLFLHSPFSLSVIPRRPTPTPPQGFVFDVSLETAQARLYLAL